jgi:acid phosphatase class B
LIAWSPDGGRKDFADIHGIRPSRAEKFHCNSIKIIIIVGNLCHELIYITKLNWIKHKIIEIKYDNKKNSKEITKQRAAGARIIDIILRVFPLPH